MTTVLVCGDRHWRDRDYLYARLDEMRTEHGITRVIEGCADGADRLAEEWAISRGVALDHYPAQWKWYGRAAGPVRNRVMLKAQPDMVVAFHADLQQSKGTKDMVTIARRAGVETAVFPQEAI